MINFPMPNKLNGAQLIEELKAQDIEIIGYPQDLSDGFVGLNINAKDKDKAETIVSNHVGVDKVPTIADKLAAVGLSIEELKTLLA